MNSKKKSIFLLKLNEYNTKKNIITIAIIVVLLCAISLIIFNATSNLIYTKGIKVYYRVYTTEKGWSTWKQNGQSVGNKNSNIKAIQIKTKSKYQGKVFYNTYSNKNWNENSVIEGQTSGNKKDNIKGIKLMLSDTLYKRYDFRYRLYTDHWSEWGSKNYEIKTKKPVTKFSLEIRERGK